MSTQQVDREKLEQTVRQLAEQLEEIKSYIEIAQNRVSSIASEIEEVRASYESLSWIEKRSSEDTIVALDRRGYAFVKANLSNPPKILVSIGRDYVVELPIDKAKSVLSSREKELMSALRDAEADLRKLLELYNQLNRKLREYLSILAQTQSSSG
ncbi:MAG: prefoldin subunit alpha [Crenarchaeota archaeon]|nr:prefoldin subunit alpha [Thermoproteota archaeon]